MLLGSTAEYVVRHANCPVLIVPSHPEIRATIQKQRRDGKRLGREARHDQPSPGTLIPTASRYISRPASPFPERRKTNKFRETHSHNGK
jgi:hypothetical protein